MRKVGVVILFCFCSILYAIDMPDLYYPLGSDKKDLLFDLGNPKAVLTNDAVMYEAYSSKSTVETITYVFDDKNKLSNILVIIGLDYENPNLSYQDFIEHVMKAYYNELTSILGKPLVDNEKGLLWKFDNAFCIFYPEKVNTILRFRFNILDRSAAKGTPYEALYN